MDDNTIDKLAILQERAAVAVAELEAISAELMELKMDLRITGVWDWNKQGRAGTLSPQGVLLHEFVFVDFQ